MFDSISIFGVLGVLLAMASAGVLSRTVRVLVAMFHAQDRGEEVMGRTIMTYVSISYVAITTFAGGFLAAILTYAAEQSALATIIGYIIISLAAIAAITVWVAARMLLQRIC